MNYSLSRAGVALIVCALLSASSSVRGGSIAPDRSFDAPEFTLPNPAIRTVLLPGGKFLRYLQMHTLAEQRTGAITRHFADGAFDPSFQAPRELERVAAAAVDSEGRVILSATQREYERATERLMRLNPDGSVDGSFNITTLEDYDNPEIHGIVPLADGKMLVSGFFPKFRGVPRRGLVRLMPDGTVDSSFADVPLSQSANFNNPTSLGSNKPVVQPDGKILLVGGFRRVGDIPFPLGVARIDANGSLDSSFQPGGFSRQGIVREPVVQADGKIVLGGRFSVAANFAANPTGQAYTNLPLVRLEPNGALDQSYGYFQNPPGLLFSVRSLALQGDKIVIADLGYDTLLRFNNDGSRDTSFHEPVFLIHRKREFAVSPLVVTVQPDARILLTGNFTDVDDETGPPNGLRYGVARFNPDGTLDPTLTTPQRTAFKTYPDSFARLPSGKTLIGFGTTGFVGDTSVPHNFGRLHGDGSLDTSFDPIAASDPNGPLTAEFRAEGFRLLPEDKIFVFGHRGLAGSPFTYGRLFPDGTEDRSITPDPVITGQFGDSGFDDVVPQSGGGILVASSAAQAIVNGDPIHRIGADGSRDPSFQFDPALRDGMVQREEGTNLIYRVLAGTRLLATQPDGKLLFVYGASGLVRLNADGMIDSSFALVHIDSAEPRETFPQIFDPQTGRTFQPAEGVLEGEPVTDAALDREGRIIIAGPFTAVHGIAAPGLARLKADGSIDHSFAIGAGPQWTSTAETAVHRPEIEQVELQDDGKLLVAGTFEAFNGVSAPGIVSLNPDGSVDTSFVPPAVRQKSANGRANFARQPDGSFLLSGPYSYPGESSAPSLLRLAGPKPGVANISTRIAIGTGENVLIGGFIITGDAPKKVIIRAIGPSLRAGDAPLAGRLEDPVMQLRDNGGELLTENDDWRSTQEGEIIASQVPPENDREAAIVATLEPGAYTATVSGKGNASGIGLVEIYDLSTTTVGAALDAKLANISTRGFVQTGDNVMIGGFIVTGGSSRLIVRAIGPSLAGSGVAGALQDTTLDVVDGNGSVLAANDNWRTGGQEQEIFDTTLPPKDERESAIVTTASTGAYTAVLRGKNNAQGVALIEVYVLQ